MSASARAHAPSQSVRAQLHSVARRISDVETSASAARTEEVGRAHPDGHCWPVATTATTKRAPGEPQSAGVTVSCGVTATVTQRPRLFDGDGVVVLPPVAA